MQRLDINGSHDGHTPRDGDSQEEYAGQLGSMLPAQIEVTLHSEGREEHAEGDHSTDVCEEEQWEQNDDWNWKENKLKYLYS